MNIYSEIIVNDKPKQNYKPTRLYIKELNGVKYFGKTTKKDIIKYSGSGKIWKNRIKKYGKSNIKTIWISEWFYDSSKLHEFSLLFSELFNIVESKEWDNCIPETGLEGGFISNNFNSIESITKRKTKQKGVPCPQRGRKGKPSKLKDIPKSEETKQRMRKPKSPEHREKLKLSLIEARKKRFS